MTRHDLLAAVLVVAGVLVAAARAHACSCGESSIEDRFADADAVFRAVLVDRGPDCAFTCFVDAPESAALVPNHWRVVAVYKGDVHMDEIGVGYVTQCDARPEEGVDRVVFARVDTATGRLQAPACWNLDEDVEATAGVVGDLAAPRPPTPGSTGPFTCAPPHTAIEPEMFVPPSGCHVDAGSCASTTRGAPLALVVALCALRRRRIGATPRLPARPAAP